MSDNIAQNNTNVKVLVIDGENTILGRLCSYAVKQALLGKEVAIVNCEKVVVSGRRGNIVDEYNVSRRRGGHSLKGPFFPRHPERLVKRTVRGMLQYKEGRGAAAFDRIKCYDLVPKEFESQKKVIKEISAENKKVKTMSLAEIYKVI